MRKYNIFLFTQLNVQITMKNAKLSGIVGDNWQDLEYKQQYFLTVKTRC